MSVYLEVFQSFLRACYESLLYTQICITRENAMHGSDAWKVYYSLAISVRSNRTGTLH